MGCKLTKKLGGKDCKYSLAGVLEAFLANWYPPAEGEATVEGAIAYKYDEDGFLESIHLPTGESFFKIEGAENSTSFTDALQVGGNGNKYRQHTFNTTIEQDDLDATKESDALSLGRYIAVVVSSSGNIRVLGRTNGLTAPADGFNYESGAAEADGTGWTTILQGVSTETAPLVKDRSVITPIFKEEITG